LRRDYENEERKKKLSGVGMGDEFKEMHSASAHGNKSKTVGNPSDTPDWSIDAKYRKEISLIQTPEPNSPSPDPETTLQPVGSIVQLVALPVRPP